MSDMPRGYKTEAGTWQLTGGGFPTKNFADKAKAQRELSFRRTAWELGITASDNPEEWRELRNLYR